MRLEELALAYVARFATSRAKLAGYLARKLRERGWDGEGEPPVGEIVARFVAAGYVDDAAFARAKSGSLLRRGYGQRRVSQALGAAGIDEDIRAEVRAGEGALRRAALALARKRGFGPFGRGGGERDRESYRATREKQIAAGIDEDVRAEVRADAGAQRRAALALARKRGFGPFGRGDLLERDRALREKQIAAMLRAGHGLDSARELVDAASIEAAEEWAALEDE